MNESHPKLTKGQIAARAAIVSAVMVVAVASFGALMATRAEPEKVPRQERGELVEVIEVAASTQPVTVTAEGTVMAAQQVTLIPEVTGRVVWVSPNLIPGSRVNKGEPLVRLDARDHDLRAKQLLAQVDSARLNLEIERSRKQIAEREWQLLNQDAPADEESLALRAPQLRSAEVALKSAESSLEQARLAVSKAVIRAPFNALVQSESVDVGQLAGPGAQVATLVGTDAFWVQVSLPVERLRWLQIPGVHGAAEGSPARVFQSIGQSIGQDILEREGKIIRLLGDLDPRGRMARVLIELADPLGAGAGQEDAGRTPGLPLLLGSYVSVQIFGPEAEGVLEIPRVALRNDDQVYVMTDEHTLDIKDVDVIWRRPESVLVRQGAAPGGLVPGDDVIVTALAVPVQGMKLRLKGATAAAPAAPAPAAAEAAQEAPATEAAPEPAPEATQEAAQDARGEGGDSEGSARARPSQRERGTAIARPSR